MMEYLIIDPYVFVKNNNRKILFYNTIDGKYLEYIYSNETWIISENIITIEFDEPTEQYKNFIVDLASSQMAFKFEGNKIFSKNIFCKINEEFRLNDGIQKYTTDEIMGCVFDITICMTGIPNSLKNLVYLKKQINIFSNADKDNVLIRIETIKAIFSKNIFPNLNSVILTGDRKSTRLNSSH